LATDINNLKAGDTHWLTSFHGSPAHFLGTYNQVFDP
jgi:hypothetical protein